MYCSAIFTVYFLTLSRRTADGIRSGSERNPIGRRTESDRAADGIRLDGGRNPAGGAVVSAAPTKQTERVFPQNTRNTQNRLAEMCRPQIGTDAHRLGRYGIPVIPMQPIAHPNFCGFREFRGRFFSASNSVRSVDSVGKPTQPNHLCRSVKSVGEHEYSHRIRRTHRTFWLRWASHRLHRFSQIRRVWHPCHTHAANSAP